MDKRALRVMDLTDKKYNEMNFEGEWLEAFGKPERTGTWIIYGNAKNGKTAFAIKLAKLLTRYGRVAYDSLEEGASVSLRDAFIREKMHEVSRRILILDKEPIADLKIRLSKPKSAQIILIDSIQYSGMNYSDYRKLKEEFRNKLFIFISHADGKQPAGRVARSIKYDANISILVESFKAYPLSRYGGGEPFTIWDEGARKFWNE